MRRRALEAAKRDLPNGYLKEFTNLGGRSYDYSMPETDNNYIRA